MALGILADVTIRIRGRHNKSFITSSSMWALQNSIRVIESGLTKEELKAIPILRDNY